MIFWLPKLAKNGDVDVEIQNSRILIQNQRTQKRDESHNDTRGPSTPNPTQVSWKTLILKKLADFSCVMWICGGFAQRGPSALLATKNASFGTKTCHSAIPRIMGQKIVDL